MELPVLRRYIEQNKEDITKIIGKEKLLDWLLFIDNPDSEYARLAESSDEAIGRAKDMLRTLSADEKLREEYLAREKAIMDHYASLKAAERYGREEERAESERKLKEERAESERKLKEERAESERKLKVAIANLLKQGVSVENIALAYQMSPEEVQKATKSNRNDLE
jgi:predicted HTH domain antitoxin